MFFAVFRTPHYTKLYRVTLMSGQLNVDLYLAKNDDGRESGTDSLALDIMRSRDHGLPGYVNYLNACQRSHENTPTITSWEQLEHHFSAKVGETSYDLQVPTKSKISLKGPWAVAENLPPSRRHRFDCGGNCGTAAKRFISWTNVLLYNRWVWEILSKSMFS